MTDIKIIILGTGQLAIYCAKLICEILPLVLIYDTNKKSSPFLSKLTSKLQIPYFHLRKDELFDQIREIDEKTIIISATNPYIIPEDVLKKEQIYAINCHHALLPKHPGRNAEAWAIFEMDKEAGITWHEVSPQVDAGNIVIQESLKLSEDYTALRLLRELDGLAIRAFDEILEDLVKGTIQSVPQPEEPTGKLHYSWEKPNDGILDLNWSGEQTSAFLRSMDYGPLNVLGKPKIIIEDKTFIWQKYKISQSRSDQADETVHFFDKKIILHKNQYQFELINIQQDIV